MRWSPTPDMMSFNTKLVGVLASAFQWRSASVSRQVCRFFSAQALQGQVAADAHDVAVDSRRSPPFFPIYYNNVYEVDLPRGHRFPMKKYRKVRMAVQEKVASLPDEERSRVNCDFRVSPLATKEQLVTTHDETYVERYLQGKMTQAEIRNTGTRGPNASCLCASFASCLHSLGFPWSLQHVNRSLSSVGGTLAAACVVYEEYEMKKGKDDPSPTWGAHVAGGTHHAFSDFGEGFCIFRCVS